MVAAITAAVAVAAATGVAAAGIAGGPSEDASPAAANQVGVSAASSAPLPLPATAPPGPSIGPGSPRQQALAFAGRLRPAASDVSRGPYSYLETRQWGHQAFPDGDGRLPPSVQRIQWWRSLAGAGRQVTWDETDGGCRQDGGDTRTSGGMEGPAGIAGRIAADPDRLRRQLMAGSLPQERRPRHVVSVIMYLPDWGYLDRSARTTIVRLLAEQPGLQPLTGVTDRAGRPAVRVAVRDTDSLGTVLDVVLLLHPVSGQLLASYDEVVGAAANTDPNYLTNLHGYRLYLDQRRTPTTQQPAAGCAGPATTPGRTR
ncbi:hypothetical protein GCM10023170_090540 [Phytohabitans houttuyneae]|uniref:Uncharacterized protein n=1 Tax=Phytohabitans houttuyneae TaxID=1076126 RepID=A0A6V8KHV6_9ACTN|nr:hypothetical protein Phou_062310 [Phytohabitans houttuyneae]